MNELISLSHSVNVIVCVVITWMCMLLILWHVYVHGGKEKKMAWRATSEGKEKRVRATTEGDYMCCCILQTSTELQCTILFSHEKKTWHYTFTHTHLCLQGTCKLEVEGCHLWLSRQKYNPSFTHTVPYQSQINSSQTWLYRLLRQCQPTG